MYQFYDKINREQVSRPLYRGCAFRWVSYQRFYCSNRLHPQSSSIVSRARPTTVKIGRIKSGLRDYFIHKSLQYHFSGAFQWMLSPLFKMTYSLHMQSMTSKYHLLAVCVPSVYSQTLQVYGIIGSESCKPNLTRPSGSPY